MDKVKSIINSNFLFLLLKIFGAVSGVCIIYLIDLLIFKLFKFLAWILLNGTDYENIFSRVILIIVHYYLFKLLISLIIFPGGFTITKQLSLPYFLSDAIYNLKRDLVYIEKNIKNFHFNRKANEGISRKIDNFSLFVQVVQKSSPNGLDNLNLQKYQIIENIEIFRERFNYFIADNSQENAEKLIEVLSEVKHKLIKYQIEFSFHKIWWKSVFVFLKLRLHKLYENRIEEVEFNVDSKNKLNFTILHPINKQSKTLMIFCNPNGLCFECYGLTNDILEVYLQNGISVLIWNYQGYGERTGIPSFTNVKFDAEKIAEYVLDRYSDRFTKFGVHGYSMGGLVACHLSKKFNKISLLVADRTFSSIDKVIKHSIKYNLDLVFRIFFPFLSHYSAVTDYIESKAEKKLILYDPNDEIIPSQASIKQEVTNQIFDTHFKPLLQDYSCYDFIFSPEEFEKIKLKMFYILRFLNKIKGLNPKIEENKILIEETYFISNFFDNFLFREHSYITLLNFDDNFPNFIQSFLKNLFVWGLSFSKESMVKCMFSCEDYVEDYSYKVVLQTFMNFNFNTNEFLNANKHDEKILEVEKHLLEFNQLFLAKLNLVYFKILFENLHYLNDNLFEIFEDDNEIFYEIRLKENIRRLLKNKVGNYLHIQCDHNGEYSKPEKNWISSYLKFNNF